MITKQSDLRWLVFVLLTVSNLQCCVFGKQQQQQEQVPCYFIFGDSFAVNGNDNDLDTYKANYLPYGSDFPAGPTGRFSNGKTMVDVLAEKVGLKDYIPPFRKVGNGTEILKGVNYASGAAIMQVETAGSKVTSISQQINFHRTIVRRIDNILGSKFKSNYYLQQCLYSVGIGSNDYLVGYYTPSNNGSEPTRKIPSEEYAEKLVDGYLFNHLNNLYNSGARKIAIFGLGPLGCSPTAVKFYATNQHCISVMDTDIHIFNSRISMVVDRFNKNYKNAKFTYINIYDLTSANVFPGFKQTQVPCCETDRNGLCAPNTAKCQNVNDYFYWDGYRPTEAANVVLANLAYNASVPDNAYPYNLQQLIA